MKVLACLILLSLGVARSEVPAPDVETVDYVDIFDNNTALRGYVSIPEVTPAPAVLIIPDWTNVDEYEQIRATMIQQQFGWVGFAADIYGADLQGEIMDNTTIRRQNAGIYRSDNQLFFGRIQAAVEVLKNHPDVMPDKIAVIGYCFGGTGVFTYSFLGATDVVGAVSFHGGLTEFPVDQPINHPVLVLSGGDDDTGTQVEVLEANLNEANATWQITRYSGIEHGFTKFDDDRYSERADTRSWSEMGTFLKERFGETVYGTMPPNMTSVDTINYDHDGFNLTGYLAVPESPVMGGTPAVVVVPGWAGTDGPDGYESQRATLLAEEGMVGFVADIYGSDLQQVEDFAERIELSTFYRTNYTLFVSRIQLAVDLVAAHELVNATEVVVIGYCFGGTGVVNYAFAGLDNVKAVVPFHGGLTSTAPIETEQVAPYVLVQSGW